MQKREKEGDMTNHKPTPNETYVQHIGRKKKAFVIKSWKDKYEREEELRKERREK